MMPLLPFGLRHLFPVTKQHREICAYQPQFHEVLRKVRAGLPAGVVDELAVPSYTHKNWLMRYLFHERLAVALEWMDSLATPPSVVMDFGCGVCLLFPALRRRAVRLMGCDIHPEVASAALRFFGIRDVEILDAREGLGTLTAASVDVILALDVLEHVDDVKSLAGEFRRVLQPHGRLLCSLPTENAFYQVGRRLAGFSGAYHVRQPRDVVRDLGTCLSLRQVGRLYPFLPLFEFFEGYVQPC